MPNNTVRTIYFVSLSLLSTLCFSKQKLIVTGFSHNTTSSASVGRQFRDYLEVEIIKSNLFEVAERRNLSALVDEIDFTESMFADEMTKISSGGFAGAELLLTGKIISTDSRKKYFNSKSYGIQGTTLSLTLHAEIRIIDIEKALILYSDYIRIEKSINSTTNTSERHSDPYNSLASKGATQIVNTLLKSNRFNKPEKFDSGQQDRVKIQVNSSPPDADIEIDDVYYGSSGQNIPVPSGLHRVRVSLANHKPWEKTINLTEGQMIKVILERRSE